MKLKQSLLLVALTIGFVTFSFAQPKSYDIKNGFAIGAGLTQFDIKTDNFKTKAGNGWMIHASATADLPHKWYNISYGMQISENSIEVEGVELTGGVVGSNFSEKEIEYKLFAAQLALLFHIKVVPNLITIDVGPMAQFNGKLDLQTKNEDDLFINLEDETIIAAKDLEEISPFNFNGAIGATLGFRFIKLRAQYVYGFTNILNKLNDQDLGNNKDFKGNQSMISFAALFTF